MNEVPSVPDPLRDALAEAVAGYRAMRVTGWPVLPEYIKATLPKLEAALAAQQRAETPPESKGTTMQVTDEMVSRFLTWKLPDDFGPDGGIAFEPFGNKGTPHQYRREPTGTNLLTAPQARAMLEHVLASQPTETPQASPEPSGMDVARAMYMDEADKNGHQVSGADFNAGFQAGSAQAKGAPQAPTDEEIKRRQRIELRLAWLADGEPVDLPEFTRDVLALLNEAETTRTDGVSDSAPTGQEQGER